MGYYATVIFNTTYNVLDCPELGSALNTALKASYDDQSWGGKCLAHHFHVGSGYAGTVLQSYHHTERPTDIPVTTPVIQHGKSKDLAVAEITMDFMGAADKSGFSSSLLEAIECCDMSEKAEYIEDFGDLGSVGRVIAVCPAEDLRSINIKEATISRYNHG